MFGIAIANAEHLSYAERMRYRCFYCGVCHSLQKHYGQLSRAALTYDLAFLPLLLGSLFEPPEVLKSGRCLAHPRDAHVYIENEFVDYAAAMTVALAFHKCLDDWADDGKITSVAYSVALSKAYRQVRMQYPKQCGAIEAHLRAIACIEREAMCRYRHACTDEQRKDAFNRSDEAANHFGAIMASIFLAKPDVWDRELAAFGEHFGRFIYFADAALDRQEDIKQGAFNPFAYTQPPEEQISSLLFTIIGQATTFFEKLPLERDLHLMRSVLYSGVWQKLSAQELKKQQALNKADADADADTFSSKGTTCDEVDASADIPMQSFRR